jgi:biotin transport system substrate-specific component
MPTTRQDVRVLADQLIAGESWRADAMRVAAANILLVLCAWIAIPLPWTPVPITGQTFGVLLVAVLLGSRRGSLVMGMYLLEGLAGLPVFAPLGAPGPARFLGPTAGYLLAYPLAAYVTGWLVEQRPASALRAPWTATLRLLDALLAGEFVIFTMGCAWLAWMLHLGWARAFSAGALPFIPGELLKLALVAAAVRGVELARRK